MSSGRLRQLPADVTPLGAQEANPWKKMSVENAEKGHCPPIKGEITAFSPEISRKFSGVPSNGLKVFPVFPSRFVRPGLRAGP
jgi:hypothetical protein